MSACAISVILPLAAIASGPSAHVLIWIHGEWDSRTGHIALYAILIHTALWLTLRSLLHLTAYQTQLFTVYLESLHLFGLFTSIITYRVFFHRLRGFPGPLSARIWIWDIFVRTALSGHKQCIVIDNLHRKYGPIVRYAPDRLSINLTAAVPLIHGTGLMSLCSKSVVYLNPVNGGSINADRNVESHRARRKLWERALSARVLPSYIPPIVRLACTLTTTLHSAEASVVDVNHFIRLFTFDTMGTIGFGRETGFDGLNTGKLNPAISTLIDMMGIGVYMMLVPWLHILADYVPAMGIIYRPDEIFRRGFAKETLTQYCDHDNRAETLSRSVNNREFKDILCQIHPTSRSDDRRMLSDCVLLAIAGADTTTSSLVHIIYRLARHKKVQQKVYQELLNAKIPTHRSSLSHDSFASWIETVRLPYIDAVIREVLRLHAPAPTGLPRLTPAEGLPIQHPDGTSTFIPGQTNVCVPVHTLMRDPLNFQEPLEFMPERFLPTAHPAARPELILDSRAYIPFLQGPYGCAGKHFAYLEMRIVTAALVSMFEIAFPEGASVKDIDDVIKTEWRDYSTVKAAPLRARFIPRSQRWSLA